MAELKLTKQIGEDLVITISNGLIQDVVVRVSDHIPPVEPPPPPLVGKVPHTVDSGGVHLAGVTKDSPVIYDNDFIHDCPSNEMLWLQYDKGNVKLVGNIMTRS